MIETTTKEKVIDYIKEKVEFSAPMLQDALELEYGEVRKVISELEDEKKIEFLEGIVYKWIVTDEEESNNDNDGYDDDDNDDDKRTPFEKLFARRTPHRPPSFLFDDPDDSDNSNDDTSDSDDDDDGIFKSLFGDKSELDTFFECIIKEDREITGFVDSITDEIKDKLLEPNGGPLPDLGEENMSIEKFAAPYIYKRRDVDVEDNAFPHAVKMIVPNIDEPFHIFMDGGDEDHHFHDNGVVVKYIKSKAKDLDAINTYKWVELIKKCSREVCEIGSFDGDIYKLPVKKLDDFRNFNAALSAFTTEVLNIISYVNTILERNSSSSLFFPHTNNLVNQHDEIAAKIVELYDSTDTLTDYLDKIVEICPDANARTAIRVAFKCPLVALKLRHPQKRAISNFFHDVSCKDDTAIIVYFVIRKINDILKSEESEE